MLSIPYFYSLTLNLHPTRPATILQFSSHLFIVPLLSEEDSIYICQGHISTHSSWKKNNKDVPHRQVKGSIMHLPHSNVLLDYS